MLTSDIASKLAIVRSIPTDSGSPEIYNKSNNQKKVTLITTIFRRYKTCEDEVFRIE